MRDKFKTCRVCGNKPATKWNRCIDCFRAAAREASRRHLLNNPDKVKRDGARRRARRKNDPEVHARDLAASRKWMARTGWRRKQTLQKYGLTPELFEALIVSQQGRCMACGEMFDRSTALGSLSPVVHHDHAINKPHVTDILHSRCNRALGQVKDDAALLMKIAEYGLSVQKFLGTNPMQRNQPAKESTCQT